MQRLRSLQVLRFVAALLVVWAHANDSAGRLGMAPGLLGGGGLQNLGAIGVDIFFVISGFIIAQTAVRHRSGAADFMRRRLLRVAPLYLLMSAPWIAAAAAQGALEPGRTVATLLFWPALRGEFSLPYLAIGWTLCFEMLFYAAVTLGLTGRACLQPRWLIAAFAAAFIAARLTSWPPFGFLGSPLILEFLAGAALARLWASGWRAPPMAGPAALALAVAGLAALALLGPADMVGPSLDVRALDPRVLLWGPCAALLVFGAVHCEPRLPQTRLIAALVLLGDASYALYLSHRLLLELGESALARAPGADAVVLVELAAACVIGLVVYRWIEQPLSRALRNLGRPSLDAPPRVA